MDFFYKSLLPFRFQFSGALYLSLALIISSSSYAQMWGDQKLVKMVKRGGDTAAVEQSLNSGSDPDSADFDGKTLLIYAAERGNINTVSLLLDFGASINTQARDGETALIAAAKKGHLEIVELLLNNKADINLEDEDGTTALYWAREENQQNIVDLLLENGANDQVNPQFAIFEAASEGDLETIKTLIDSVDVNYTNDVGATALIASLVKEHEEVAAFLIENGADVTIANEYKITPLMTAVLAGFDNIVDMIIAKGADVNAQSLKNGTALTMAAHQGHEEILKKLLEAGADPNLGISDNDTPFVLALKTENEKTATILLNNGADTTINSKEGYPPVFLAAAQRFDEIVTTLLLNPDAEINYIDERGANILFLVARNGDTSNLRTLLERGADPNVYPETIGPGFMFSALNGNEEIASLLIPMITDINFRQSSNQVSGLYVATQKEHANIVRTFLENGANPNITTSNGITPLMIATSRSNTEIIQMLIEYGADKDLKDTGGRDSDDRARTGEVKKVLKNTRKIY